ncbi:MAG: hypothetical protein ACHRXM_31315 [Isosphaerales bacterium]
MPLALSRPSFRALALKLSVLGVWVVAAPSFMALAAPASSEATAAPRIYHKQRNFRIPFSLNAEGRDRIKELHLLVSEDLGYHWRAVSKTFPDHPTFTFRSSHDGEYWFAVQTRTIDGKVSPSLDSVAEPNLKVVVDSFPPSLLLEPEGRRGSLASVRWEVKDENLDLKSLVLEYQVEGAGAWRRVPIRRPKPNGGQQWDAGTAEALKVRASVADKAGNVTEASVELPEGTSSPLDLDSRDASDESPPSIAQISNGAGADIVAGPGFTPVNQERVPTRRPSTTSGRSSRTSRPRPQDDPRESRPATPDWRRDSVGTAVAPSAGAPRDASSGDLFATSNGAVPAGGIETQPGGASARANPPPSAQPSGREGGNTLLVSNPKFKLQYAVDDAGPNGPATVELWITQDGGRTWIRRGDDPDRVSPIDVDLGGEGTYGLCLVARSASGLGDQPPAPGDAPQSWVEVDGTPPLVQLQPPQVGTGVNSGKVAIAWRASDLHLPPKSVSLSWRPDQPGAAWQILAEGQDNAGQFVWTVPVTVPQRFHLKVEAVDSVGHHGSAETTDMGPIVVDRSRPRSRIIGLDPNARAGSGGAAGQLR